MKRMFTYLTLLSLALVVLTISNITQIFFQNTLLNPSGRQASGYMRIMSDEVIPRLQLAKNTYTLKDERNVLIGQADAADATTNATSYIVTDFENGQILFDKNSSQKLPIASLTKIMTAIVSLDLASPNDTFTVSDDAAHITPTRLGVVPGQKMTLHELLEGLLMTSANDTAQVIRENIDSQYKASVFIQAMNEKAKFLGLSDSSFANPQGFDSPNNYSTVHDLAILTHYALKNYPLIAQIAQKSYDFLPEDGNHKQYDVPNWNGLIGVYPDTIGMKIGNTGDAGHTTIVVSKRDGHEMLAVVLGAPGLFERDMTAANLLDMGYEKALGLSRINVTRQQLQEKYNSWYQ